MSMRRIAFGGLAAWLMLTALPAFAAMRETPVDWTVGSQRFSGVLVYDDAGGKRAGLVMVMPKVVTAVAESDAASPPSVSRCG